MFELDSLRHILVVDDEEPVRRFLLEALGAAGYTVGVAENGRTALEHLIEHPGVPSAIVVDASMPMMTGIEFVTILRCYHRFASVPIVLLGEDVVAPSRWVQAVLPKPVEIPLLLDLLARLS